MKKALKLLVIYFVSLIITIVVGSLLNTIYLAISNYVVGTKISLFNFDYFMPALFNITFSVLFLICPLLSLYRIKQPSGIAQALIYIFLVLFTWGFLFPANVWLEGKFYQKHTIQNKVENLTPGYFRSLDNKVFYFTNDPKLQSEEEEVLVNALIIDRSELGEIEMEELSLSQDSEIYQRAKPYRDILIKEAFESSAYKGPKFVNFHNLIKAGKDALNTNLLHYLGFCSLGLLMASVYALTGLFNWKLLNLSFVIITNFLIISFNSVVRDGKIAAIINKIAALPFVKSMENIFDHPTLVLINSICFLVITIIGIIIFIVKNCSKKKV
ncbi:MAG: hypothetical protein K5866_01795 [Treponema sp.]|nr:hypothetical protein [Treponema sp.]